MEVRDIRIGNRLNYDLFGHEIDVRGVGTNCIWVNDTTFGGGPLSSDHFSPIELTEEKILGFGFEIGGPSRYGKKYRLQMADWGFVIETHFDDKTWFFGHEYYDSGTDSLDYTSLFFCYNLKYVHQLQNIYYSLVGEELV